MLTVLATILRFPGVLLTDNGGFRHNGKYYASIAALMESLSEAEIEQTLDWIEKRYPRTPVVNALWDGGA